ncbi:hypothetical protein, partial [Helicobacter typhlonius]
SPQLLINTLIMAHIVIYKSFFIYSLFCPTRFLYHLGGFVIICPYNKPKEIDCESIATRRIGKSNVSIRIC